MPWAVSAGVGFGSLVYYIALNTWLQVHYYRNRSEQATDWKIQPSKNESLNPEWTRSWWFYPFASKPNRPRYSVLIPMFNLTTIGCFAAFTTECIATGASRVVLTLEGYGVVNFVTFFVVACVHQHVLEYYWHRFLHLPLPYAYIHKVHHAYKSPEPFDDMYAHPFENTVYYCMLFSPAFLIPIHWLAFLLYVACMGLPGVLDHSGVRFVVPWLYDTEHHDNHHKLTHANYAFPVPYLDLVHSTFTGTFNGKEYVARTKDAATGKPFGKFSLVKIVLYSTSAMLMYIAVCNIVSRRIHSTL